MSDRGRKQAVRSAAEYDVLYGRRLYCYLARSRVVKSIKRQMNRRLRRELKREASGEAPVHE